MKKFLLALGFVSLVASQGVADTQFLEGKVIDIENWEGTTQYFVNPKGADASCLIRLMADPGMSSDGQKAILASMLTAQASGQTVKVWAWGDVTACGNNDAIWFPGFRVSATK